MIYGRVDPQDIPPVAYCLHCGGEIYPGETVYAPSEYDGMVHEECARDWLFTQYAHDLGMFCEEVERWPYTESARGE